MLRRFLVGLPIWTLVVAAAAAPSFMLSPGASVEGRLAGMAVWIVLYALIGSSEYYADLWSRRPERTAIVVTYGIRAFLGLAMVVIPPLAVVDMLSGLVAVLFAQRITGHAMNVDAASATPVPFVPTLIATVAQGTLLSLLTWGLLIVVRGICLAAYPKASNGPRGFEVVTPPKPDDRLPPQ